MVAQGKRGALRSPRITHHIRHVLQLKVQLGALYRRDRLSVRGMWLLVLPLGFCWNSLNHVTTLLPPSPSPSYLHQENLSVHKSHHVFRANDHISPPATCHCLCSLPKWGFLRPGCPGCMPRCVFARGWGEGGVESEGMCHHPALSLIAPLLGVLLGRADKPSIP